MLYSNNIKYHIITNQYRSNIISFYDNNDHCIGMHVIYRNQLCLTIIDNERFTYIYKISEYIINNKLGVCFKSSFIKYNNYLFQSFTFKIIDNMMLFELLK